jgi:hypothetical protein
MIGLYSEQQIITSNDDSSLLDPALESSNYFATGADRLKVDLSLASLVLDSEGNVETADDFIPLLKFNKGIIEYVKVTDLRSAFDDKLAERTYDESGNYVVDNFTILPEETAEDSETMLLKASSGKAYVGGYQVKTLGPTEIRIPKNTKTETKEFYNVNTTQGNYIKISAVEGILPRPQALVQSETFLELHSELDGNGVPSGNLPTDESTRVGIIAFKGIEYDSFYIDNLVYKLFNHYIALKPDAPLSWAAWADAYNIPEDEGRYLSSILYEGQAALGTVKQGATNITIYGLYREPDASGLAFWYRRYRENGKNVDNILQAFYDAATGLDKTRLTQSSKAYLSVSNGSPFYDGITNTSKITHIVGVPNEYTDHAASGSYSSPFFRANVHVTGRDTQNQIIIFDKKPSDRLIFPLGKSFIKSLSKLQTSYTKVFRGISFVSGSYTTTLSLPESFPLGDGTVPPSTSRAN